MESMGVVVRRYIDFLILLIPTPLVSVLFCSSIPTFCSFLKCFSFFYYDDDEGYKKVPFLSISLRQLFVCWRSLGSYPGLEICSSLQVYVEVEPSGSQLGEKAVKALY